MLALNSEHIIGNIGDPDLIGTHDDKLPLHAIRATTEGLPAIRRGTL